MVDTDQQYTTISIRLETKLKLERLKSELQLEVGRRLSWDDFFEEVERRLSKSSSGDG